ncbi:MAG: hypothetical protein A3H93_09595 [Rhodocyclales bacterium RIFCSPLOWO2_02_FULL_63_24]|nr:MAG: hypothetical protein A2040_00095 [Rhodocyclales bacterium GWA2_65_19]OHC68159.1 MAG: hypothetical protein A3H93_09595 [Rhodocyclales bacterium RIFCSPLOWO2_02_FULL_63_24]
MRWLARQTGPWPPVFDNAADVEQLRLHVPQGEPHHLVITSRNAAWGGVAQPMELSESPFWFSIGSKNR